MTIDSVFVVGARFSSKVLDVLHAVGPAITITDSQSVVGAKFSTKVLDVLHAVGPATTITNLIDAVQET